MELQSIILNELTEASEVLKQFLSEEQNFKKIELAARLMSSAINNGNKIISCGNGGSLCDAMHFAEEMTGRFRENRDPLPAVAISDPGHLSCTANDYGYEYVFSRYVQALGRNGDVLLAISTSGNSENVINAISEARNKEIKVVALLGKDGGKIAGSVDVEILVPHNGYAERIQEIHIKIIHVIVLLIEKLVK